MAVAFDLNVHYNWNCLVTQLLNAISRNETVEAVIIMRQMAVPMGGFKISKNERLRRSSLYSAIRDSSSAFIFDNTLDWGAVEKNWTVEGNHFRKMTMMSLQNRPVNRDAVEVYAFDGRPKKMGMFVQLEDVGGGQTIAERMASWKFVIRVMEVHFIPGNNFI